MATTEDIAPPEQSVWMKYSPHHEFPLASVGSLLIHGILLAGLYLIYLILSLPWYGEAYQPPGADVAYIIDGGGSSSGGGSGGAGGPGGTPGPREESVRPETQPKSEFDLPPIAQPTPPIPVKINESSEFPVIGEAPKNDFMKAFSQLSKNLTPDARPTPKPGTGGAPGLGTPGPGGTGKGRAGTGPGDGPPGNGGTPGGMSRAEILARRWAFTPTGSSSDHIQKLNAIGVKLGFIDGNGLFWMINDVKQRPVRFSSEKFEKFRDTVRWENRLPESVAALAAELRMPAPPRLFIMFLPQDKEQILADAELEYAKSRNHDLKNVTRTWFDFRVNRGVATPIVRAQEPYDPPVYRE
jgi:hypothetical protein